MDKKSLQLQHHYGKYVTSGGDGPTVLQDRAVGLGYDEEWLPTDLIRNGASLFKASCGSGCPLRLPLTLPWDDIHNVTGAVVVMDIGCGAGHDVILANRLMSEAAETHPFEGQVIGLDVTTEMIQAARKNLQHCVPSDKFVSTEFIECNIEKPEPNLLSRFEGKVDLVISNGVLNLCQDKLGAFKTIYQLLKNGGQLAFSDVMKLTGSDIDSNAKIATSINGDIFSS